MVIDQNVQHTTILHSLKRISKMAILAPETCMLTKELLEQSLREQVGGTWR